MNLSCFILVSETAVRSFETAGTGVIIEMSMPRRWRIFCFENPPWRPVLIIHIAAFASGGTKPDHCFYDATGQHLFFEHPLFRPTYGAARRTDYPGQSTLSWRRLLRWFSTLHWGIAGCCLSPRHGRKPNPITQRRVITIASAYSAVKAIACCQNFTRSGGHPSANLTICCCALVPVSIDRTFRCLAGDGLRGVSRSISMANRCQRIPAPAPVHCCCGPRRCTVAHYRR